MRRMSQGRSEYLRSSCATGKLLFLPLQSKDEKRRTADDKTEVRKMRVIIKENETGFLTNSTECELLIDEEYQKKLAEGIAEGIILYLN